MKNYWYNTQKGKVIRIMIRKGQDNWYEDFDLEKYKDIFVGNNAWARLSQLLKDWVVEVKYYENPNKWKHLWYKRALYRLVQADYYKKLYNEKKDTFWKIF